jgi:hypothetical protein
LGRNDGLIQQMTDKRLPKIIMNWVHVATGTKGSSWHQKVETAM